MSLDSEYSEQENIDNKLCIKEESTYPFSNKISYKECKNNVTKRSFNYLIIKEGVYPVNSEFPSKKQKTNNSMPSKIKRSPQHYKIPYNYIVETTWGRAIKKRTVRCEIDYNKDTHIYQFQIKYGSDFQQVVSSNISPTTVAKIYEQALNPNTKATISGHIAPPLFSVIPINNIVFDELHVFLRITDRLWALVIAEIKEHDLFNDLTRKVIVDEMQRLKVSFYFWENKDSKTWEYTSLVGDDKEIVIKSFNLQLLFRSSRANLIRKLWDDFYELYCSMKNKTTDPIQLKKQALDWLLLFLTPSQGNPNDLNFTQGLYLPNQITSYMHVLVYHGWELLKKHQRWGLRAFSCSAVEKKNHNQVSAFFRKTLKNGGNLLKRKPAIQEIIEFENRTLYFTCNPLKEPNSVKKLRIKRKTSKGFIRVY
ncbi:hypothetical protein Glove_372g136 [Diversispora epigaea]|uniref:Uncharacterized protein n=1 Tax=Diversispora epigaea TaxID=1348612 RepID=A0A397HAL3_9GLOM|nr:hypothetical protein Glove_372g136 [Diversispora epigaea]